MKFKIHFEHLDETLDEFIIEEDSLDKIRGKVLEELTKRKADPANAWSEEIKE